ncbi:MAG: 6,7-dimethyl-8-ribityllumazine synthase [Verrucomicrobia bacterium]|nr:6,7-dimethyl-8-ribityllumazine synthase [Verrucomicrobiota bacterium]
MLKQAFTKGKSSLARGARFAIVASKYNTKFVDGMLRPAKAALVQAGAAQVEVVRVPGAFEIPAVAAKLAAESKRPFSAIICLGVILRGETTHAEHIGQAVSHAFAEIQVAYRVPVIHEVLLLENEEQARVRCLSRTHNRGLEAANTAIDMAQTMKRIERLAANQTA